MYFILKLGTLEYCQSCTVLCLRTVLLSRSGLRFLNLGGSTSNSPNKWLVSLTLIKVTGLEADSKPPPQQPMTLSCGWLTKFQHWNLWTSACPCEPTRGADSCINFSFNPFKTGGTSCIESDSRSACFLYRKAIRPCYFPEIKKIHLVAFLPSNGLKYEEVPLCSWNQIPRLRFRIVWCP